MILLYYSIISIMRPLPPRAEPSPLRPSSQVSAATTTLRGKHRRTCVCAVSAPGREPVPKGGPRTGPK